MKTPEEIKKGLECCYSPVEPMLRCEACPYNGSIVCKMRLHTDALALIQQFEVQNAELVRKTDKLQSSMGQVEKALQDNGFGSLEEFLRAFSQVKRERDAAVKILTDIVHINEWLGDIDICAACKKDKCKECRRCNEGFEWRGVPEKEENNG